MKDRIGEEFRIAEETPLTPREAETLLWSAEGKSAADVGAILGISERTANVHLQSATRKLDALNKAHAIARAFARGMLVPIALAVFLVALFWRSDLA